MNSIEKVTKTTRCKRSASSAASPIDRQRSTINVLDFSWRLKRNQLQCLGRRCDLGLRVTLVTRPDALNPILAGIAGEPEVRTVAIKHSISGSCKCAAAGKGESCTISPSSAAANCSGRRWSSLLGYQTPSEHWMA